ncbi:ATP-grasp domain-containing protein [candidate division CSSED10-310 bacterium]|uniref:ATP-grasp domain-containing protein n=1 Tax=candidate division CSSED10-310 bacterium TaxID=2855610 RepID=A0ABV6Z052_UNCC1
MARLEKYFSKKLLQEKKIAVPEGGIVSDSNAAVNIFQQLNRPVRIQPLFKWQTEPVEAVIVESVSGVVDTTRQFLELVKNQERVQSVLVEEKLDSKHDLYIALTVDEIQKAPLISLSSEPFLTPSLRSLSKSEGLTHLTIDLTRGIKDFQIRNLIRNLNIDHEVRTKLGLTILRFYQLCKTWDIIQGTISPLVITTPGHLVAAHCELIVDDYAISRNPELDLEAPGKPYYMLSRPQTEYEKLYTDLCSITDEDTDYFLWENVLPIMEGDHPIILFLFGEDELLPFINDALLKENLVISKLCRVRGQISASRLFQIFNQLIKTPNLEGFLVTGSGFSQINQTWLAHGLMKSFRASNLNFPGIIRFDTLHDERALEIIRDNSWDLPATIECFNKDDSLYACIKRLRLIIKEKKIRKLTVYPLGYREKLIKPYTFETKTGATSD